MTPDSLEKAIANYYDRVYTGGSLGNFHYLYDESLSDTEKIRLFPDLHYNVIRLSHVRRLLPRDIPKKKAYVIGCVPGLFLPVLTAKGAGAWGVGLSLPALKLAKGLQ